MEHNIHLLSDSFIPHGHCYLWTPALVWMQVISNGVIALAYSLIPFVLVYFVRKRKDLVFKSMFILFGLFIISCGSTHIMHIVTIWYPLYWLDAYVRAFTAVVSIFTGLALIPLIPKALSIPSPAQLQLQIDERIKAEDALKEAHEELRKMNRELEQRVQERTNALSQANEELKKEITERRRIEEELLRANQDLEQFAYIASHDLQEPLRMVSNYTQLLQLEYDDKLDESGKTYIHHATSGAKRMQSLISDVLSFSRIGRVNNEVSEVDLNETLKTVQKNLEVAIEENKALIVSEALPVVKADKTQMLQLFQNLISNALKYRSADRPEIRIKTEQKDNELIFSVSDNGIGIDKKYFERIFIMFQRLHPKDKYPGTGMGLAICNKIVKQYGGRLWVKSEEGKGSTFYFTFPSHLLLQAD